MPGYSFGGPSAIHCSLGPTNGTGILDVLINVIPSPYKVSSSMLSKKSPLSQSFNLFGIFIIELYFVTGMFCPFYESCSVTGVSLLLPCRVDKLLLHAVTKCRLQLGCMH